MLWYPVGWCIFRLERACGCLTRLSCWSHRIAHSRDWKSIKCMHYYHLLLLCIYVLAIDFYLLGYVLSLPLFYHGFSSLTLQDKSSTSNLKIEALIFTRLVLASNSPSVFHPYIKVIRKQVTWLKYIVAYWNLYFSWFKLPLWSLHLKTYLIL